VLIYCDMGCGNRQEMTERAFEQRLEQRWQAIEADTAIRDLGLAALLPRVKPRIIGACRVIRRFLVDGFDGPTLDRFVASHAGTRNAGDVSCTGGSRSPCALP
jgi:hypothetical protein